jgi:hypothetical protein
VGPRKIGDEKTSGSASVALPGRKLRLATSAAQVDCYRRRKKTDFLSVELQLPFEFVSPDSTSAFFEVISICDTGTPLVSSGTMTPDPTNPRLRSANSIGTNLTLSLSAHV